MKDIQAYKDLNASEFTGVDASILHSNFHNHRYH